MHKVLIADDEKLIREGMRSIIDWGELHCEVAAVAADGVEALGIIESMRPEICLIDIGMPGLTGLEVIAESRRRGYATRFIILSGYRDFDFARSALRYSVTNYLLKPLEEDELIATLKGLIREIEKPDAPAAAHADMVALYAALAGFSSPVQGSVQTLCERIEARGYALDHYQLMRVYMPLSESRHFDLWLRKKELGFLLDDSDGLTVLLQKQFRRAFEKEAADRIFSEFFRERSLTLDAVCAYPCASPGEIPGAAGQLNTICSRRYFNARKGIAFPDDIIAASGDDSRSGGLPPSFAELRLVLCQSIELGEFGHVIRLLNYSVEKMAYDEHGVKSLLSRLSLGAIETLTDHYAHIRFSNEDKAAFLDRLLGSSSFVRSIELLVDCFTQHFPAYEFSGSNLLYRKMRFIIERHYHENIRLKDLAEILSYSSAYLGKLFKSESGESFNCFLDKLRIQRAKELLEHDCRVYQVAEKVGYGYVDYFHSKFRKYTGLSPLEYRKQCSRSTDASGPPGGPR